MASVPPDSILPEGWTWGDVGHGALDVAGFVPGYGEAADLANAAWYAGEDRYLEAGLSLISMVPIVGDAIGKGGKLASKMSGPALKKMAQALLKVDFAAMLRPLVSHPTIGPKLKKIVQALEEWRGGIVARARKLEPCPADLQKIVPKGWQGNPMRTEVGNKIIDQLIAEGRSLIDARAAAQQMLESGTALAKEMSIKAGDKLYKLTPSGTSPGSPYWMTAKQLEELRGLPPREIASRLGLPPGSIPPDEGAFLVQSIEAKQAISVFESTIAPVANGAYSGAGGALQTLVPSRSLFTPASPPAVFR